MTKEEFEKLKETVAYFGHWYDVLGEERVSILEKSIKYIAELEKENEELPTIVFQQGAEWYKKKADIKLTKAKELLKEAQGYIENNDDELYDKIEQFLKEIEK